MDEIWLSVGILKMLIIYIGIPLSVRKPLQYPGRINNTITQISPSVKHAYIMYIDYIPLTE